LIIEALFLKRGGVLCFKIVAPLVKQAKNGENKSQPAASGETGLLDSNIKNIEREEKQDE
jgi:hypothetical protein